MTENVGDGADELKALRDRYVPRGITTAHPIAVSYTHLTLPTKA